MFIRYTYISTGGDEYFSRFYGTGILQSGHHSRVSMCLEFEKYVHYKIIVASPLASRGYAPRGNFKKLSTSGSAPNSWCFVFFIKKPTTGPVGLFPEE